jgi:prepilin-type N-terminal cleavage/methylation domain-containing protein
VREEDHGFSLIEVVFAALVLAVAAAGVVGLCATAVRSTSTARTQTLATLFALEKLDELRASGHLASSPGEALEQSLPGYSDWLDGAGEQVTAGFEDSGRSVYLRRWSVHALPEDPLDSWIVQVLVAPVAASRTAGSATGLTRVPGDALVVSMATRKDS